MTEYPQIDAVLSANDGMALGALEALKEANRTAIVIGINGILPAVKQIETGALLASVDFNMFKIGCTATRAAVRYLKGEQLPEKIMLPAEIIDKSQLQGVAGAGGAAELSGMERGGAGELPSFRDGALAPDPESRDSDVQFASSSCCASPRNDGVGINPPQH